jgi:hypothetical protein
MRSNEENFGSSEVKLHTQRMDFGLEYTSSPSIQRVYRLFKFDISRRLTL